MISGMTRRHPIQWMLLGVGLLTAGALLGLSLYSEYGDIDALERDRLQVQARVVDENLARQMEGVNHALASIRDDFMPWGGKSVEQEASIHLKSLGKSIVGVRTLGIVDAKGTTLASSREELIGRDFSEREYFRTARAHPDPDVLFISPPFQPAMGALSINLTRAVVGPKGEFAGVVTAVLDPQYLAVLLNSILYTPDMRASIVHGEGRVVVEEPGRKDLAGMDLARPGSRYTMHAESGRAASVFTGMAFSTGDQRMSAWRTIRPASLRMDRPLMVSVNRGMEGIFASWRRDLYIDGGMFGALVLITALGLLLYQRRQVAHEHLLADSTAERERAQEAIEESRERYRGLSEAAFEAIFISVKGICTEQNRAAELMFGYTDEEAVGRSGTEWIAPQDRGLVVQNMRTGYEQPYEVTALRKDGSTFPALLRGRMMQYQGKQVRVTSLSDITQRKAAEQELKASMAFSELLLESMPLAVCYKDVSGRYTGCNSAFSAFVGKSQEEIVGKTVFEVWPQAYAQAYQDKDRDLLEGPAGVQEYETRFVRSDGTARDLVFHKARMIDEAGRPTGTIGVITDITERKQAEQELKASMAFRELLLEAMPLPVFYKDTTGRYTGCNSAFTRFIGKPMEEIVGKTVFEVSPQHFANVYRDKDLDLLNDPLGSQTYESRVMHSDGTPHDVIFHKARVVDDAGNATGILGVITDVSELKRAQAALHESEARLSTIFLASPIGLSVTRIADGKLLECNDTMLRMFGYSRDELIGRTAVELGIYAKPAQREEVVQRLRDHGRVDGLEVDCRHSNGEVRVIELSCRVIELQGEQCAVAMMLEITDRKRLEAAHLQAQKLESLGTLAGGIAHDFNNILAAIRGNANLAAEDVGPGHIAAESLQEIKKAGARATELVRRITAFGRPKETRHEMVDLSAVADEVLKLLRATLPAGISLRKAYAGDTPGVLADAGQIHEAIVNLTTNAAHAIGPRAGSIEYRLEPVQVDEKMARGIPGLKPGRYARLTVRDSGSGMDAGTMERIFDAFYTTKPVGEGTGLGLSMVHGIMKGHSGAVTVESVPGKGSSLALYFPAAEERVKQEAGSVPAPSTPCAPQRVLYVDDEEALVFLARRVLTRLGHRFSGFSEPREALEAFRAAPQDYDVLVTDLSMPLMSGFELARAVLALRPGLPVLMTSGHLVEEDERRAREAGIRRLILKPVTMEELGRQFDAMFGDGDLKGRPAQ